MASHPSTPAWLAGVPKSFSAARSSHDDAKSNVARAEQERLFDLSEMKGNSTRQVRLRIEQVN